MPYTVNGIGTWYYGKKNEHSHQGVCEFCGKHTQLKSYETTKFFVFAFIPIIPLGKKRVIDQCSICRKHRVVSLKDWERSLKQIVDSQYQRWIQDPNNTSAAVELFKSIAYFRDVDSLNSVARDVRMHCSDNAQILNALGLVHTFLNKFDEAEDFFRSSLALTKDIKVEENLAEALMKNLKPDQAKPYVEHIIQEKIKDRLYYIYLLIESYQYVGDHKSALEVIEKCENAFPELKDKKPLRTYRKKSQRNYNKSRRIKGSLISERSEKRERKLSFILPNFIFPAIVVLGLMLYIISSFLMGLSREVYLVNGLDTSYTVEINGKEVKLLPNIRETVKVREGIIKVDILDLDLEPDEKSMTVDIKTSFWSRPFNKPIYIINPDKVAVLQWQETQYAADEKDNEGYEPEYRYYTGQYFYELDKVDYLFTEFPESIEMGVRKIRKTQLIQLSKSEIDTYFSDILASLGSDGAKSYLEARLNHDPDNELNIYLYLSYFDPDSAIEFLKAGLDERPLLINWHRIYQTYMEIYKPMHDLHEEYSAYLEKEKDNKALYYLLSRTLLDPKEAEKLLIKSIEGNDPCPYGYYGLAYQKLSDGDYEQAFFYAQKAIEALPEQDSVNMVWEEALWAQGEYDLLLEKNKQQQRLNPYDGASIAQEVCLYMAKGDLDSAKNTISTFINRISSLDSDVSKSWEKYLNGVLAYCSGDVTKYVNSIEELESSQFTFEKAFIKGDFDNASKIAVDNDFVATYFLLLYLADNNPDSASRYLQQAIDKFKKGDKTDQLLADYLSGERSFDLDEVKSIVVLPDTKCIVMAALGKLNPDYQEDLYTFAKKLNYKNVFPYHFINRLGEES